MSSQNTAKENHPLLIMRPTKISHYANLLSSFILILIVTIPSILFVKILKATFFRINWIQYLDSLSTSTHYTPPEMLTYGFWIILITLLLLVIFCWVFIGFLIYSYALINPFYWLFALRYKKYSIYRTNIVVEGGLFIKTKKIYPYRSITSISHNQTVIERLFGISSLGVYIPKHIPLLITRVEKETLWELFTTLKSVILLTSNRNITKLESNSILIRGMINNDDKNIYNNVELITSELRSTIGILKNYFEKKSLR